MDGDEGCLLVVTDRRARARGGGSQVVLKKFTYFRVFIMACYMPSAVGVFLLFFSVLSSWPLKGLVVPGTVRAARSAAVRFLPLSRDGPKRNRKGLAFARQVVT